jgi:hypothetical protein
MRRVLLTTVLSAVGVWHAALAADDVVFKGVCDASAGWPLDDDQKLIAIGEDEHDVLLVYATSGGNAEDRVDVDPVLRQDHPKKEADIEAVAGLGCRLYWITGHGRNDDGEAKPDRRRVLATSQALVPEGEPVTGLAEALRADGFADAIGSDDQDREDLAAERNGLNIEALAAAPPGIGVSGALLIGLRNPLAAGARAIVVPFLNPAEAVDTGAPPRLGSPLALDLDGRGLRDMVWSPAHGAMLLLGGAHDDAERFALFTWSGDPSAAPALVTEIVGLHAEAVVAWPASRRVLLLSDDGDRMMPATKAECEHGHLESGMCPCKRLRGAAAERKEFRGRWLDVP